MLDGDMLHDVMAFGLYTTDRVQTDGFCADFTMPLCIYHTLTGDLYLPAVFVPLVESE